MNFTVPPLPLRTRLLMLVRLLTVQGSYNYETMIGNGIAFAIEPALRMLPGGRNGDAYRDALARESRYFNAHPYLASVAVGALAHAELALEDPARIERFRTAVCGPLGSVGDRLVWAGWLPLCSLVALAAFGFGASPLAVVVVFLVLYNAGHLALRAWGLNVGWRHGLGVASVLANPVLQRGPAVLSRASAAVAGAGLPVAIAGMSGSRPAGVLVLAGTAAAGAALLSAFSGRLQGWRVALILLVIAALAALVVP
ncbi:MAG TPA: PTS system mannose/fructose/sorbose family transporter subunit IID, partial [Gemmatimonadaceae bacterium]|nr:PTS system mannose/fructose/sorbose family transporter subunit IID [Gemmatimonadaceae bacterium]